MRLLPILTAAFILVGCQTTPPSYSELDARLAAGEQVPPELLRRALFETEDLPERMERLSDLERQALGIVEDEPLKLGSLGSAILDTFYGSLTGHYILARFYRHLETPEAAEPHAAWVTRIQDTMEAAGDGTRDAPMPAVTTIEARMYAMSKGWSPVGSIYQSSDETPFSLLLQVKPPEGPIRSLHFDLTPLYESVRADFGDDGAEQDFTPFTLIGYLAKQRDTAAQAAVGAFLATQDRLEDAVNWLRAASTTGNLLANSLLARVYWEQARQTEDPDQRQAFLDEVMENYLHAIALGSAESMYALGVLYINGHYGAENAISGVSLLQQAADLDHAEATMFLGHLHYSGETVTKDLALARAYYRRASELGNPLARYAYARFVLDPDAEQAGDQSLVGWLRELAEEEDAQAMLLLGNLHARGLGVESSSRNAVRWFKRAVKVDPVDANIVNEIAWTLTVTDKPGLRRPAYARQIMDHLMNANAEARMRPEYLDTWAATYAATEDFEQAVTLQEEALKIAELENYVEVQDILREHLEDFKAGRTLTESIP